MKEIWRDFPDKRLIGSYEVSNFGRVRSLERVIETSDGRHRIFPGVILKQAKDKHGYMKVTPKIRAPRKSLNFLVSRAVALTFCHKPEGCDVVNHLDGDKTNNHASNLEWTTVRGNTQHSFDNKLQSGRKGSAHHACVLDELAVKEIIKKLSSQQTQKAIAEFYGVSPSIIGLINRGKRWGHISVASLNPPYSSNKNRSSK
ncbi:NUMOD4 domain-containing protein [Pantoea allii]|uniref:NUMOD4 domain-containing protein n=1 Tax=Pantoea allii TaxID=574096 RepID=UPI003D7A6F91